MFPTMSSAARWNGVAFCLVIALMCAWSLPQLYHFAKKEEQALDLFLNGELTRKFEKGYDKKFPIRDGSITGWANLQYMLFKEGATGVVLGKDGWLFTNEEYLFPTDFEKTLADHMQEIALANKKIQKHSKRLVIVPVPMKLDIYSEYAIFPVSPVIPDLYADFVKRLDALGIANVPVRDSLKQRKSEGLLFLTRDTHWTPLGAQITAQAVTQKFPELKGDERYASKKLEDREYPGDLLNYIKISPKLAPGIYNKDVIPIYETLNQHQNVEAALFGGDADDAADEKEQIAVVGSSYTEVDEWNFVGFLKEELGRDMVTVAVKAKGPFFSMDKFLNDELLRADNVNTVIWEFPVRTLLAQKNRRVNWRENLDQLFE